jgi:hypothetical protein
MNVNEVLAELSDLDVKLWAEGEQLGFVLLGRD